MTNPPSLSTYTTMMRVTTTGRPYAQDLHDLFSALIIQQGLKDHRYRFRTYPASFTTEEATETLGHLQFTQNVRTTDPDDPSRQVATRTTTTFSMSREMAKLLGQHFLTARLIENALDPSSRTMRDRTIWSVTAKGKAAIRDFSQRALISISHLDQPLSRINSFAIVSLDRIAELDDRLAFARPNMTVAFKTMMNCMPTNALLADDAGGIDIKTLQEYKHTFFGYQCFEWISQFTTVVTREEAELIASEFVLYGWISQVLDKSDRENSKRDDSAVFKMGRNTTYYITERGRKVLSWDDDTNKETRSETSKISPGSIGMPPSSITDTVVASSASSCTTSTSSTSSSLSSHSSQPEHLPLAAGTEYAVNFMAKSSNDDKDQPSRPSSMIFTAEQSTTPQDSHWDRLHQILEDPLMRMYFRDFMKSQFCEENVNIWVDYFHIRRKCKKGAPVKELLRDAYVLYDTYLSPNATAEVNIDHALRHEIIQYVSSTFSLSGNETGIHGGQMPFVANLIRQQHQVTVVVNGSPTNCLRTLLQLYDRVNEHICRTMALDSVPKFAKTEKYKELMSHASSTLQQDAASTPDPDKE